MNLLTPCCNMPLEFFYGYDDRVDEVYCIKCNNMWNVAGEQITVAK